MWLSPSLPRVFIFDVLSPSLSKFSFSFLMFSLLLSPKVHFCFLTLSPKLHFVFALSLSTGSFLILSLSPSTRVIFVSSLSLQQGPFLSCLSLTPEKSFLFSLPEVHFCVSCLSLQKGHICFLSPSEKVIVFSLS